MVSLSMGTLYPCQLVSLFSGTLPGGVPTRLWMTLDGGLAVQQGKWRNTCRRPSVAFLDFMRSKTWDVQIYASNQQVKSGCLQNKPCNTIGLVDGAILAKNISIPQKIPFCLICQCHTWDLEQGGSHLFTTHQHKLESNFLVCQESL